MTESSSNYDESQYEDMQENPLYISSQSQPNTPIQIYPRVGDSSHSFFHNPLPLMTTHLVTIYVITEHHIISVIYPTLITMNLKLVILSLQIDMLYFRSLVEPRWNSPTNGMEQMIDI